MSTYTLVSDEDIKKYAPELLEQGHFVVSDGEKLWIVKHKPGSVDEEKRDLLGYLLGYRFANVAEVKLLALQEHEQIKTLTNKNESSLLTNTFFVRLAGAYSPEELPCKTLEEAVATELVYSTWIRRRDAHVLNRVYIEGIPIFFDFQTAFLGEKGLADIKIFFSEPPADYGRASAWRTRESSDIITTSQARAGDKRVHYVRDLSAFKKQIDSAVIKLRDNLKEGWEDFISQTGFNSHQKDEIVNFLKRNLESLEEDLKLMQEIIFKD